MFKFGGHGVVNFYKSYIYIYIETPNLGFDVPYG
jgi:hypothetical protein